MQWHAQGYQIVETSAKPNGAEIGLRGKDSSGRITFLAFLFLMPDKAPISSAKCRNGAMEMERKQNATLRIETASEMPSVSGPPIARVNYIEQEPGKGMTLYVARGFIANAGICADLEFYSEAPINTQDAQLKAIFESFRLNPDYKPDFNDIFLYGEILFRHQMYADAGPVFEVALQNLPEDPSHITMRRVTIDQAGMSYGIAGDIPKARAMFNSAIQKDPDYPMYYYNLACADAQEKNLADAQVHLRQAFDRKANVIHGEAMPDPTKDDSFLPYRDNKEFWAFLGTLH